MDNHYIDQMPVNEAWRILLNTASQFVTKHN